MAKKYSRDCDKCKKELKTFIKISVIRLPDYKTILTRNYDYCLNCFKKGLKIPYRTALHQRKQGK